MSMKFSDEAHWIWLENDPRDKNGYACFRRRFTISNRNVQSAELRITADSRYDAFQSGERGALSEMEQVGLAVFQGRGQCAVCHGGPNLTDNQFHNTGISWRGGRYTDEGRFVISQNPPDHGAFKTPTLREIGLTAPYMHDGSVKSLEDVVEFYSQGGRRNPYLDPRVRPLGLSRGETNALVAFLKTLDGRVTAGQ